MNAFQYHDFNVGDKILVRKYHYSPMSGGWYEKEEYTNRIAIIIHVAQCEYAARFVDFAGGFHDHNYHFQRIDVELIEKNYCKAIPGIDYPMYQSELDEIDTMDLVWKYNKINFRHEGFCNYPTFLAHLYLNNESGFRSRLPFLYRKDGSINPEKIKKVFYELKLKIDEAAFCIPIDFPERFKYLERRWAPKVNWEEVAANFSRNGLHE